MNDKIERLRLAAEDAAGGPPSVEQVEALIELVDALEARLAALTNEREHMQSLAKWVGVSHDTSSLEIACEVSCVLEDAVALTTHQEVDARGVQRRMLAILNSPEVWDAGEEPAMFLPERAVAELFAAFPMLSRADEPEIVEVAFKTVEVEKLGHLLVQLSPATLRNAAATVRRLMEEMNIKEVVS